MRGEKGKRRRGGGEGERRQNDTCIFSMASMPVDSTFSSTFEPQPKHLSTSRARTTTPQQQQQETYDFLKSVCPDVRLCRGDFDSSEVVAAASASAAAAAAAAASSSSSSSEAAGPSSSSSSSGDETVLSVGGLRLGLAPAPADEDAAGNASDLLARRLGVDVLVTRGGGAGGKQQHELRAGARRGRLFVNPGSATGAWSPSSSSSPCVPSFVLMDCSEGRAMVYMYRLLPGDELKVEKLEYRKSEAAASPAKKAAAPAAPAAAPAAPPAATATTAAS